MKLLLTSNGLVNDSIKSALEELVGKPRKDIKIAFIPTAGLAESYWAGNTDSWLADDITRIKDFAGYVDLVSLADSTSEGIIKRLEYADVIFVGGGLAYYLSYWMGKLNLFELMPKLLDKRVYVGISAGSMIATPTLRTASGAIENREAFLAGHFDEIGEKSRSAGDTLKLVDFCIRPHIDRMKFEDVPNFLEKIVEDVKRPLYAIDDQTALKVIDAEVEVVTEGEWELINPN